MQKCTHIIANEELGVLKGTRRGWQPFPDFDFLSFNMVACHAKKKKKNVTRGTAVLAKGLCFVLF